MKTLDSITEFLNKGGEPTKDKLDTLFQHLYPEIKKIANAQLSKMNSHHVLSPTILVNECFLKLKDYSNIQLNDRKHFYRLASRCMRFYLVDMFRNMSAKKNDGIETEFKLDSVAGEEAEQIDLLSLDTALKKLELIDSFLSEIVELRFFGGFSMDEIAELYDTNKSKIYQKWLLARSMLLNFIDDE